MTHLFIVTGSSGLIGRKLVQQLSKDPNNTIIGIDKRDSGFISDNYIHLRFNLLEVEKYNKISQVIESYESDSPIFLHLAAEISVEQSMSDPDKYYKSNVDTTKNILEYMRTHGYHQIIFSSTAAVYAIREGKKCLESDPTDHHSFYGTTKLLCEELIKSYCSLFGFTSIIFRFFNVAGGKDTDPEPHHLIPILIDRWKKQKEWILFGTDHHTEDGTCIRDYIHVSDIVLAFISGIRYLSSIRSYSSNSWEIINLGRGKGDSVRQIIKSTYTYLQKHYPNTHIQQIITKQKRKGDPAILVADNKKAHRLLGWKPIYFMNDILRDTINEMT